MKNTAFGMLNESKEEIITEAFTEAVEDMAGEIEDRITEEERQKMIDDGTLADHTIKQNPACGRDCPLFRKKTD